MCIDQVKNNILMMCERYKLFDNVIIIIKSFAISTWRKFKFP